MRRPGAGVKRRGELRRPTLGVAPEHGIGERLDRLQWVALGLAAAGVLNQVIQLGQLPWVSLVLTPVRRSLTI